MSASSNAPLLYLGSTTLGADGRFLTPREGYDGRSIRESYARTPMKTGLDHGVATPAASGRGTNIEAPEDSVVLTGACYKYVFLSYTILV